LTFVLIIQPFLVLAYIEVTNISYTCRMNANISGHHLLNCRLIGLDM